MIWTRSPLCHIPARAPTTSRAQLRRSTILSALGPYTTSLLWFWEFTRELPSGSLILGLISHELA
ncbi:hypothetical protein DVH24_039256 [Malus domestica]|uniref:Uncharacterized protein n=1 Tax=Malus domestica TaxID=3750 RepID=A0A498I110_MALDO|nr:hypothetical protein DVH24_039256 [Malus domestica]